MDNEEEESDFNGNKFIDGAGYGVGYTVGDGYGVGNGYGISYCNGYGIGCVYDVDHAGGHGKSMHNPTRERHNVR